MIFETIFVNSETISVIFENCESIFDHHLIHEPGHIPEVETISQCTLYDTVDMSTYEIVGVTVVSTEHHHIGGFLDEGFQTLVILGCATFADNHQHARLYARTTLLDGRALMVGGDAGSSILLALSTCESWGMSVDGLAVAEGSLNLAHHLAIGIKHTWIVHHLGQA